MTDKLVYTIPEAAKKLGISRDLCYDLARRNELPTVRLGRRVMVPIAALEKWITNVA